MIPYPPPITKWHISTPRILNTQSQERSRVAFVLFRCSDTVQRFWGSWWTQSLFSFLHRSSTSSSMGGGAPKASEAVATQSRESLLTDSSASEQGEGRASGEGVVSSASSASNNPDTIHQFFFSLKKLVFSLFKSQHTYEHVSQLNSWVKKLDLDIDI